MQCHSVKGMEGRLAKEVHQGVPSRPRSVLGNLEASKNTAMPKSAAAWTVNGLQAHQQ